jgi:hypothetical protein
MRKANHMGFKEWAVICAALGAGRQSLILRKGGIHEGDQGFQLEQDEFWLFPTYEHEQPDELVPDARPLFDEVERARPALNIVRITQYAIVEDVVQIRAAHLLPSLTGLHVWSDRTVDKRFHYKHPGLFVITVRVYRTTDGPIELPNSPHFGGCRSWVELPSELPTAGLVAVLDDAAFSRQRAAIQVATSPIRLA